MRFKRPIYRILFYTGWLVLVGGIVMLLVAANKKAEARRCKGVAVSINNDGDKIYVEKEDVLKSIQKSAHGSLVNKHTGDINLALLETALEKDPWVQDAELYFDTKDILHVAISERLPMARIFTASGSSFYIDSTGAQMPLLETYSTKLPVVTGFVPPRRMSRADSALLKETKEVVKTISADPFWNAQIGQIDITPERKFELVPVVGSSIIRLGSGTNVAEKLAKLMVFYKQVLLKAGFAKYSALDLQFDGQIVAVRKGATSVVDSLQLQKNIKELMDRKMAEQEPEDEAPIAVQPVSSKSGDIEEPVTTSENVVKPAAVPEMSTAPALVANAKPAVVKPAAAVKKKANIVTVEPRRTTAKAERKTVAEKKPKAVLPTPKAVMPKKTANEY